MMRKLISGIIAIVFAIGAVGCGGDSEDKPTNNEQFISEVHNDISWIQYFDLTNSEIVDMGHDACTAIDALGLESYVDYLDQKLKSTNLPVTPYEIGEFVRLSIEHYCPEYEDDIGDL